MDSRNIKNGYIIRTEGYSDQPYVIKTDDGNWLMVMTVSGLHEGASEQHIVTMRSYDKGQTWTDSVDVASPDEPESSYAVLYKAKYGRVYCFYNFNADNIRWVIGGSHPSMYYAGMCPRVDTLGHFVFKYSDDNGLTWSEKWYDIPQRDFEVDRLNPYGGKIKFFWNVGKPLEIEGRVLVPLYKIREFGDYFMTYSEGVLLECDNINTEKDPEKLNWKTLPDGDIGIRAPHKDSRISEEHSFVRLSDGTVFCTFRTTTGHPYCSYSHDDCHTFSDPEPLTYENGRLVKHPRAANFIWKCENGKYLYWYHNNGGRGMPDRNPVFLCGAKEILTDEGMKLAFGQPKPVLYDENYEVRMSYPDMLEDGGEYYLTETQKKIARVHKVDKALIESLWDEPSNPDIWKTNVTADMLEDSVSFEFETGSDIGVIFKAGGFEIERKAYGDIVVHIIDTREYYLVNDDILLEDMKNHTVRIVFDMGIRAVYFVTDGIFCDGGDKRVYGFALRLSDEFAFNFDFNNPEISKISKLKFAKGIHLYD